MKKIFIFLVTLILTNNNYFFAALSERDFYAIPEDFFISKKQTKINELNRAFMQLKHYINKTLDADSIMQEIREIKELFLNLGIDPNIILYDRETPLTSISRIKEYNDLAFWLVNNGADVNKLSLDNVSPLYSAAESLNFDLIKFFIEQGADVNFVHQQDQPRSVLFRSTFHSINPKDVSNWKKVIKQLLLNGAKYKNDKFFYSKFNNQKTDLQTKSLFELARMEIIDEYHNKIDALNKETTDKLIAAGWPAVLPPIVQEYLIPKYAGEQILDNILYIRYLLGELSPIQKQNFQKELNKANQQQQQHPAAAAAAAQAE